MTIDRAYRLCLWISNKEQRGSFPPDKFNLLAPIAQVEVINDLLGNEKTLNERGVPPYGYKFNRKIDTYLRPIVVPPVLIEPTALTITGVTKANPGVVTVSSIGNLTNGTPVLITGVVGMTQLNGNTYIAKNISGNTFRLYDTSNTAVNTSSYGTYSSGGSVYTGEWEYPSDFIWPDALTKLNGDPMEILDSDQYMNRKNSVIKPPTTTYPVIIFEGPRGKVEPFNQVFRMSYVGTPADPYWAYTVTNDEPVYTGSGSVDFALDPLAHLRICMKILAAVGINLSEAQILQFSAMKDQQGA